MLWNVQKNTIQPSTPNYGRRLKIEFTFSRFADEAQEYV
jgi:hypothetical protein